MVAIRPNIFFRYMMLAVMLPAFFSTTVAQTDGNLGSEQIDVVKDYSPTLADAQKVTFQAPVPQLERIEPKLDYFVPVKLLDISYAPPEIRPIAIAREKPEPFRASYIKAGLGTQWTPFFEALYNNGDFQKGSYGLFYRHLSSRGSKLQHQDFSDNNLAVFGNYFLEKMKISSEVDYQRNSVYYYGYNHEDTTFEKKDVKQRYSLYQWVTELRNSNINKANINYYSKLDLSYLSALSDNKEFNFNIHLAGRKRFKNSHFIDAKIDEDYTAYSLDSFDLNRNIFSVNGKYTFNDDSWNLSAGLTGTWEGSTFHLFPDFGAGRKIIGDQLVFYNGWTMWLQKNSFKTITEENPYVAPDKLVLKNSRIEDRYTGIKGTVLKNLTYDLRFTQKIVRHMPLYINDSTDMKKFLVIYDNRTSIINLHGEVSYKINDNLNIILIADYFRYDLDDEARAWHRPAFYSNLGARYKIADKIFLSADIYGTGGAYARIYETLPDSTRKTEEKLGGIVDINVGAAYQYSELLSFFINLNNLASVKYERWYRYPTYGFNGMVGAKLTF